MMAWRKGVLWTLRISKSKIWPFAGGVEYPESELPTGFGFNSLEGGCSEFNSFQARPCRPFGIPRTMDTRRALHGELTIGKTHQLKWDSQTDEA